MATLVGREGRGGEGTRGRETQLDLSPLRAAVRAGGTGYPHSKLKDYFRPDGRTDSYVVVVGRVSDRKRGDLGREVRPKPINNTAMRCICEMQKDVGIFEPLPIHTSNTDLPEDEDTTGFSSEIGTKLRDWAVGQAWGSCYSWAALS